MIVKAFRKANCSFTQIRLDKGRSEYTARIETKNAPCVREGERVDRFCIVVTRVTM